MLSGSQVRADSTEVEVQAGFCGERSGLKDIVPLPKK